MQILRNPSNVSKIQANSQNPGKFPKSSNITEFQAKSQNPSKTSNPSKFTETMVAEIMGFSAYQLNNRPLQVALRISRISAEIRRCSRGFSHVSPRAFPGFPKVSSSFSGGQRSLKVFEGSPRVVQRFSSRFQGFLKGFKGV